MRCPAVTSTESGRPRPSHARWALVEKPPLLRPSAPSVRFKTPLFRLPSRRRRHAGALAPRSSLRSPPTPPPRPRHSSSAREPRAFPGRRRAANAREAVVAGLPGTVALGQIAPRCAGPELPQDAVDYPAVLAPAPAGPRPYSGSRGAMRPLYASSVDSPRLTIALASSPTSARRGEASTTNTSRQTRPSRDGEGVP